MVFFGSSVYRRWSKSIHFRSLPPTWGPSTATKCYFVSSLCSYKLVLQKKGIRVCRRELIWPEHGPHLDGIHNKLHSNHAVVSTTDGCYALFGHNENLKQLEVDPKKCFCTKQTPANTTVTATGLHARCSPAKPQLDRQALSAIIPSVSPKSVFWKVSQLTNVV